MVIREHDLYYSLVLLFGIVLLVACPGGTAIRAAYRIAPRRAMSRAVSKESLARQIILSICGSITSRWRRVMDKSQRRNSASSSSGFCRLPDVLKVGILLTECLPDPSLVPWLPAPMIRLIDESGTSPLKQTFWNISFPSQ